LIEEKLEIDEGSEESGEKWWKHVVDVMDLVVVLVVGKSRKERKS